MSCTRRFSFVTIGAIIMILGLEVNTCLQSGAQLIPTRAPTILGLMSVGPSSFVT